MTLKQARFLWDVMSPGQDYIDKAWNLTLIQA